MTASLAFLLGVATTVAFLIAVTEFPSLRPQWERAKYWLAGKIGYSAGIVWLYVHGAALVLVDAIRPTSGRHAAARRFA
jgi:hypothetical protein